MYNVIETLEKLEELVLKESSINFKADEELQADLNVFFAKTTNRYWYFIN